MTYRSIRTYYDKRYTIDGGDTFPPDPSRYRAWFGSLPRASLHGAAVLDYGCGVGYVCSLFANFGYEVTGVDISRNALEIARQREPRATFVEATADGILPFDDASFDVIACLGVLEHIPEPAPIVSELRRVAREGARAVWVVPNALSPYFWFGHGTGQVEEHPRTLDGWQTLLAGGGWIIDDVRRDPGPIDRPISAWKRLGQGILNRLPLKCTYQFAITSSADTRPAG